jgi:hypothetical protein
MFNNILFSLIYLITFGFFFFETSEKNVWKAINIISYIGHIDSLTKLLKNNNGIRFDKIKIIIFFCVINSLVILSSIFITIKQNIDCYKNNCINLDNNSYDLIFVITNCLLFTYFLIHYIFNIGEINIFIEHLLEYNQNNYIRFQDYESNKKIKTIISIYICLLCLIVWIPFIVQIVEHIISEQTIISTSMICLCTIFIIKSIFVIEINKFRELYICIMAFISLVTMIGISIYELYIKDNQLFIFSLINFGLSTIIFIIILVILFKCKKNNNEHVLLPLYRTYNYDDQPGMNNV